MDPREINKQIGQYREDQENPKGVAPPREVDHRWANYARGDHMNELLQELEDRFSSMEIQFDGRRWNIRYRAGDPIFAPTPALAVATFFVKYIVEED